MLAATLFAFLGVIRQAHDNFVTEQTSDQILALMGKFGIQWVKQRSAREGAAKFTQLDRQFDELMGPRRRQLEKPLKPSSTPCSCRRNLASDASCSPSCRRSPPARTTKPTTISPRQHPPPRRVVRVEQRRRRRTLATSRSTISSRSASVTLSGGPSITASPTLPSTADVHG